MHTSNEGEAIPYKFIYLHLTQAIVLAFATLSSVAYASELEHKQEGLITLYEDIKNQSEISCSLPVPGEGSDDYKEYQVLKLCKDDELTAPSSIRIRQAPAAAQFIMSEDEDCKTVAGGNWYVLETTRSNARLEKLGIDKIGDYSGYLTNTGTDSNDPSIGFKLLRKGNRVRSEKLACISIKTSGAPASASKQP